MHSFIVQTDICDAEWMKAYSEAVTESAQTTAESVSERDNVSPADDQVTARSLVGKCIAEILLFIAVSFLHQ